MNHQHSLFKNPRAWASVVVASLLIAACGGDDGGGPGQTPTPPPPVVVTPPPPVGGSAIALFAGNLGGLGSADGIGSAARFGGLAHLATDNLGNVYVADKFSQTVRKITAAGVVTTLAGTAGIKGSANGTGAAASFASVGGIAVDSAGNVYVADSSNGTIRKITPAGLVSTLAGRAGVVGSADGSGAVASFYGPGGIAVDGAGNVYVADNGNFTVRKITPAGVVSTVVGVPGRPGFAAGALPGGLSSPRGVAVSGSTLYITMANGVAVVTNLP